MKKKKGMMKMGEPLSFSVTTRSEFPLASRLVQKFPRWSESATGRIPMFTGGNICASLRKNDSLSLFNGPFNVI